MEGEDWDRIKRTAAPHTPFAKAPHPDPRAIVDALMDPERKTLRIKKEVTGDAE
ncbi:MAG: hypothetical protein H0U16_10100 [Actinobacteria bacterium]|nr:hypothetical protein [Actinomycetota bacterium]